MDWINVLYMPVLTDLAVNFQVTSMFKVHLLTYLYFPFFLTIKVNQIKL